MARYFVSRGVVPTDWLLRRCRRYDFFGVIFGGVIFADAILLKPEALCQRTGC